MRPGRCDRRHGAGLPRPAHHAREPFKKGEKTITDKPLRPGDIWARTTCIFCNGLAAGAVMSGEHLWPRRIKTLFTQEIGKSRLEVYQRFRMASDIGEGSRRQRHGAALHTKLKVVCNRCNNGWMNDLEKAVMPDLEPIILGEPYKITPKIKREIVRWVAMKVFVLDHSPNGDEPPTPIYSLRACAKFKAFKLVPPGFHLWIGRGGGPKWHMGMERHSTRLTVFRGPMPPLNAPPTPLPENIQAVTWGIGNVVFFIIASTEPNFYRRVGWEGPPEIIRLWPFDMTPILWPPNASLPDTTIDSIALSLFRFASSVTKNPLRFS
jgi:hypothetical protein